MPRPLRSSSLILAACLLACQPEPAAPPAPNAAPAEAVLQPSSVPSASSPNPPTPSTAPTTPAPPLAPQAQPAIDDDTLRLGLTPLDETHRCYLLALRVDGLSTKKGELRGQQLDWNLLRTNVILDFNQRNAVGEVLTIAVDDPSPFVKGGSYVLAGCSQAPGLAKPGQLNVAGLERIPEGQQEQVLERYRSRVAGLR